MSITVSTVVAADPTEVWETISAPGYLERCHPFCESNPVDHWPGAGSRDTIHYYGGRVVQRMFTSWHEGSGYDLVVRTPNGDDQAVVRWRIEAANGSSRLTISLQPRYTDHLPPPLRQLVGLVSRSPMRRYVRSVVAGVKHHTETGGRVVRNQFGAHRWFSPSAP